MPATACVPSTTSTLRDGLSTGPRRHPRVPLDTRHSARSQEGKDQRPRTKRHLKVPLVTRPSALVQAVTRKTRDGCGPHAGSAVAACRGRVTRTATCRPPGVYLPMEIGTPASNWLISG